MSEEQKIAALEARIAELEARANPPRREPQTARLDGFTASTYAAIDRACVPREMTREMEERVGTAGVRELVEDERKRRG